MKKILTIALAFAALAFTSCQKEPIGGTAVESASGEWYVKAYAVFEDGSMEDVYGNDWFDMMDKFHLLTYNTSDNTDSVLYVDDLAVLYSSSYFDATEDFKVRTNVNLSDLTFSATGAINEYGGNAIDIQGGILKDAAKNASGMPVDSIWMTVKVEGSEAAATMNYYFGGEYLTQWDHYLITGTRYTGFALDE